MSDLKPNDTQIKAYKMLRESGQIPDGSRIVIKPHEIYCYLPDNSCIIAIHVEGLITYHTGV